jgi:hypothetical protein
VWGADAEIVAVLERESEARLRPSWLSRPAGLAEEDRYRCGSPAELAEQRRQWITVVDTLMETRLGLGNRGPLTAIPRECRV